MFHENDTRAEKADVNAAVSANYMKAGKATVLDQVHQFVQWWQ